LSAKFSKVLRKISGKYRFLRGKNELKISSSTKFYAYLNNNDLRARDRLRLSAATQLAGGLVGNVESPALADESIGIDHSRCGQRSLNHVFPH